MRILKREKQIVHRRVQHINDDCTQQFPLVLPKCQHLLLQSLNIFSPKLSFEQHLIFFESFIAQVFDQELSEFI